MANIVYLFGKIDSIELLDNGLIRATTNGKSELYRNTDARMLKIIQEWLTSIKILTKKN